MTTRQVRRALERQRKAFEKKFGRAPTENDPIFFDPSKDTPQQFDPREFDEAIMKVFEAAGTRPEIVYAYKKTGRIVTEHNQDLLSEADLAEWHAAIDEYEETSTTAH